MIGCRHCGRYFKYEDEWEKCEEKCRRIKYLKTLAIDCDLELKSDLDKMSIGEINKVYEKIITYLLDNKKISDLEQELFRKVLGRRKDEIKNDI